MVVTISNHYGSGAIAIARRAAEQLGYALVDEQLPVVVAKRLHISEAEAKDAGETGRSLGSRLLSSLELATPEISTSGVDETLDEALVREVREAVVEYAAAGNVVIVGRGAGAILGRRPDVLRVFMHAPREWRVERIAAESGVDLKTAASELDRIDRARRAHLRDWYRAEIGAPDLVDLSIDTATFGLEGSAAMIVAAVHER